MLFLGVLGLPAADQPVLTPAAAHPTADHQVMAPTQVLTPTGAAGCPTTMKGVLFNHVSKCGGTTIKELLREAMGVNNNNVTYLEMTPSHGFSPGQALGSMGSLVVQEDSNHDLKLLDRESDEWFTIGLVRRPCDYMISQWAWMSVNRAKRNLPPDDRYGAKPPYDSKEDLERFRFWANLTLYHKAKGDTLEQGSFMMSSHIERRFEAPENVHCWIRTHEMVKDLKMCMGKYEQCGGTLKDKGLSEEVVQAAMARAESQIPHTPTAPCSTFFDKPLEHLVMQTEQDAVDRFNLVKCCSH